MTQVTCRGCGRAISSEAMRCPQCGARGRGSDPSLVMGIILIVLIVLVSVL